MPVLCEGGGGGRVVSTRKGVPTNWALLAKPHGTGRGVLGLRNGLRDPFHPGFFEVPYSEWEKGYSSQSAHHP